MEKAAGFGAYAVFFEASRNGKPSVAQAFVFVSDGPADDPDFGETHRRLWSWGGIPLIYRKTSSVLQLFRCSHEPDFLSDSGATICRPYKTLAIAAAISSDPWWDAARLRNGTIWDDPDVCEAIFSTTRAAHRRLLGAVKSLYDELNHERILKKHLRRKLLILSLLIAYLEERGVFQEGFFAKFLPNASKFFEVLANGSALVALLSHLEERFNGKVFALADEDAEVLRGSTQLARFARMIEGRQEHGQLTLWQLYSFKDLPVELISHIYQLFVEDVDTAVYTPPFVVRLMLDEAMSWDKLDRLHAENQIILDPCCGSGIFLVEAYKRLVMHWRIRNDWKRPNVNVLKSLLKKVHGVDVEAGAIELAAFSLCLALCDALERDAIRASIKLFPQLADETLHESCFFEAKERDLIKQPVGIVVGNPPFTSSLNTEAADRCYLKYTADHGALPDKQLAYLFLYEAMRLLATGGILSMLQQYNFLYNRQSLSFRRQFFSSWDVREILDFISIRGLFKKGNADTKVIIILAQASCPPTARKILHATFRRNGRVAAGMGFDIDHYDMHWVPRDLALRNDGIWRANLLGGGRVLALVDRLKEHRTLRDYAEIEAWPHGEGFIEGKTGKRTPAPHLTGKKLIPANAISDSEVDRRKISTVDARLFKTAHTPERYSPPMLLIREHMDLGCAIWTESYATYKNKVVGICAKKSDLPKLKKLHAWIGDQQTFLQAYMAATSIRMLTQRSTTLSEYDVLSLPYPETGELDLSENERTIADDIVRYYVDLIRLGDESRAMKIRAGNSLKDFCAVYTRQINSIYREVPLKPLESQSWPGLTCQPFVFGSGRVDWNGTEELREKLSTLLDNQKGATLRVTRVARIYDRNYVFLLKPNRLRYWLRSVALRDADETLSDLRSQGF